MQLVLSQKSNQLAGANLDMYLIKNTCPYDLSTPAEAILLGNGAVW